jgi:hypothetical protein
LERQFQWRRALLISCAEKLNSIAYRNPDDFQRTLSTFQQIDALWLVLIAIKGLTIPPLEVSLLVFGLH